MADTSSIINGQESTYSNLNYLSDSIINAIQNSNQNLTHTENNYRLSEDSTTLIFICLIIFYLFIKIRSILLSKDKYYILRSKTDTNEQYINAVQDARYESLRTINYNHYNKNNLNLNQYDVETILDKYFVYFKKLDKNLQYKFLERVMKFMHSKNFLIYSDEPYKEMPVIISAAAVQISFGLKEFELPYYKFIQVKKEEYFAEGTLRVLAGNVEGNSITLAWNQVLKGFNDKEDGDNVGLHEIAHALYFQKIIIEKDTSDFAIHFNQLMKEGEYILEKKVCPYNLFTPYAFTNLQEFYAVSIELFFEKTIHLQTAYPNIFEQLQKLLNQNPLVPNQPVNS